MVIFKDASDALYDEYQSIIAKNVELYMQLRGLSGRQLAERMNSDPRVIYNLLKLETAPSLHTMCKLVIALELDDISDLLDDD